MENNLAYEFIDKLPEELIDGRLVAMSPATTNHNRVKGRIFSLFDRHLQGRTCEVLPDGEAIYLTETDHYIPDAMIVCDPDKIKPDGVHGAPDLVVEVLSPSTANYDRGRKKNIYEKCGVKEYWLVDPVNKSVEQYLLTDGRLELNRVYYASLPDWMLARMKPEERETFAAEIKCSLYDDFSIRLEDIFARVS